MTFTKFYPFSVKEWKLKNLKKTIANLHEKRMLYK